MIAYDVSVVMLLKKLHFITLYDQESAVLLLIPRDGVRKHVVYCNV
jgi:hypothetical protein